MEHWHPDPEFFFKPGAGPVLDVGPYYITTLVNLLGPVARVRSVTSTGFPERVVTAEGPRRGQSIVVETPTTVLSLLEFAAGAQIIFGASWDVWRHSLPTDRALRHRRDAARARSQFLQRRVETTKQERGMDSHDTASMPLGAINWPADQPRCRQLPRARRCGEMAAPRDGRPQRASGRLALHVLEVMDAILEGRGGRSRHRDLAGRKTAAAQRRRRGAAVPRVNFGWTAARADARQGQRRPIVSYRRQSPWRRPRCSRTWRRARTC